MLTQTIVSTLLILITAEFLFSGRLEIDYINENTGLRFLSRMATKHFQG